MFFGMMACWLISLCDRQIDVKSDSGDVSKLRRIVALAWCAADHQILLINVFVGCVFEVEELVSHLLPIRLSLSMVDCCIASAITHSHNSDCQCVL